MKILHTSDLHIGKRVNEYSMVEDQRYVLDQIVRLVSDENPDAIVLAGDIYDKSVPSGEAVTLFDDFLVKLSETSIPVLVISGNHDSAERIAFASRIMKSNNIYLSPVYDGKIDPVIIKDVAFYLVPFIKPAVVQHYITDGTNVSTYNDAMKYVVDHLDIDRSRRNVIVTHQYITDAERSDSENYIVGGLDNIDASVFDAFDYVALGHLHRPQHCGRPTVRYSGSPMKYSFSEVNDRKSVSIVEFGPTGDVCVSERELKPLHDWKDIRGKYDELVKREYYQGTTLQEDYVRITLTDEDDILDAHRRLQTIYHNLMELHYDNKRTRAGMTPVEQSGDIRKLSPLELFSQLFEQQNGMAMSAEQKDYVEPIMKEIFSKN